MSKLPVSAVIVAYHSETTLERCLRSCADLVDEIIVAHDGPCQDRSLEISRRYTYRVYVRERVGNCEPHRVFTHGMATHEWILQVDADEFLSESLKAHLQELIVDPAVDGYEFRWPTWYKGKYYHAYSKLCLFRKQCFYIIGAPSEHLKPVHTGVRIKYVPYIMEHRPPYDNLTLKTFRRKWAPWARIQAEYYLHDFQSIPKYNYPYQDWEFRTRIRLRHPILLGVFGTSLFSIILGVRDFAKTRQVLFLKSGFLHALFSIVLYGSYWKYKRWGLPTVRQNASANVVAPPQREAVSAGVARAQETATVSHTHARSE